MPLRNYRPTSPGLRQMTRPTFEEITTDQPHKPLTEKLVRRAGRNSQGKLTVRHQGSRPQAAYRVIDWKRDKFGVPARSRRSSTTRTARRASACCTTPTARSATCSCRTGSRSATSSPPARTSRRAPAMPCRCRGSRSARQVHNIELTAGRAARSCAAPAQRPAARQGGRLRHPAPAVGRGAPRAHRVHGHRRPGEQPRSREPEDRQGRSGPHMGKRPTVRGVGDEPARPSARWRRGQAADRHAAQDEVGQAGHGPAHPRKKHRAS
jgi:large subunit ribosomal protein L2